jgi:hypothetical protein
MASRVKPDRGFGNTLQPPATRAFISPATLP